jgi:hypothetical protein
MPWKSPGNNPNALPAREETIIHITCKGKALICKIDFDGVVLEPLFPQQQRRRKCSAILQCLIAQRIAIIIIKKTLNWKSGGKPQNVVVLEIWKR